MSHRFTLFALILFFSAACGGEKMEPPPMSMTTTMVAGASNACDDVTPRPTDLFRDADGASELIACPLPADPVEAALFTALLDEGQGLDVEMNFPVEGSLDVSSLSSTGAFALSGGTGVAPPPTLIIQGIEGSSTAADWEVVSHGASFEQTVRLVPSAPLAAGRLVVGLITTEVKDGETPQKNVVADKTTALLLSESPIPAGAEGLDQATIDRLERFRLTIAPALEVLAGATPPLPRTAITAIAAFRTLPEPLQRTSTIMAEYTEALTSGRYGFEVTLVGGELPPEQFFPGAPPALYENIQGFRRGTIKVPRFVGDDLRQRSTWPLVVQETEVPFLMSIPRNAATFRVVVFVGGFGRGQYDGKAIANEFAGTPEAAVLSIDLRCHGNRSPDATGACIEGRTQAEAEALTDDSPNNGNPELVGGDNVPDASGEGFFPGDPRALRDTQIASAIEIMHILETVVDRQAFADQGLPVENQVHLIAQGHAALPAAMATAFVRVAPRTVQLPSGGTGIRSLILDGPAALRTSFEASLPDGIGAARADEYVARLEAGLLQSIDIATIGPIARERLVAGGQLRRALLAHGNAGNIVPEGAREALIDGMDFPDDRVRNHSPTCDDFFIFSCRLGQDDPNVSRQQMASFMNVNGASVLGP